MDVASNPMGLSAAGPLQHSSSFSSTLNYIIARARSSWLASTEVEYLLSYKGGALPINNKPPKCPTGLCTPPPWCHSANAGLGPVLAHGSHSYGLEGCHCQRNTCQRQGDQWGWAGSLTALEGDGAFAGGELFLFDRKKCRFFRSDNVKWKKNEKGVLKEWHFNLKGRAAAALCCFSYNAFVFGGHASCPGRRRPSSPRPSQSRVA